jgi:hypothetical protein
VEVIDGYGDVVFGIEEGRVDVVALEDVSLANCASLDVGSAQWVAMDRYLNNWEPQTYSDLPLKRIEGQCCESRAHEPEKCTEGAEIDHIGKLG